MGRGAGASWAARGHGLCLAAALVELTDNPKWCGWLQTRTLADSDTGVTQAWAGQSNFPVRRERLMSRPLPLPCGGAPGVRARLPRTHGVPMRTSSPPRSPTRPSFASLGSRKSVTIMHETWRPGKELPWRFAGEHEAQWSTKRRFALTAWDKHMAHLRIGADFGLFPDWQQGDYSEYSKATTAETAR